MDRLTDSKHTAARKIHMEPDGMDLWKTVFLYGPVVVRFHVGLFQGEHHARVVRHERLQRRPGGLHLVGLSTSTAADAGGLGCAGTL